MDISSTDGPALAEAARTAPAYSTTVMDHAREDADALVAATIAANLGGRPAGTKPAAAKTAPQHISAPAHAARGGAQTLARDGAGAL